MIQASLWLDRLLLRGVIGELMAAGIRFRAGTEAAIGAELRAIPVDAHHIIDHHYIAGRLKPSCWRPWSDDRTGFPQARYLAALSGAPDTNTGDAVKSFIVPEVRTLAKVKDLVWLYVDSSLAADPANIQLSPPRELVLIGWFSAAVLIVAYEPAASDADTTSRAMFVRSAEIGSTRPAPATVPVTDCTAAVKAATDPLNAQVTVLKTQLSVAVAGERERIARLSGEAEAVRIRGI